MAPGSAPPTPSSRTSTFSGRRRPSRVTSALRRAGVLDDVRERLGDDEVRARLDLGGTARGDVQRRPGAPAATRAPRRRPQTAVREDGREDAVGQLPQLRVALLGVVERLGEQRLRVARASLDQRPLRELERDDRVHEPLLGAVVEVAHDAAARLVARGEHAGARRGELVAAVGVRDRGVEQRRRTRPGAPPRRRAAAPPRPARGDHPPEPALDDDRRADGRVDVRAARDARRWCRCAAGVARSARSGPCARRARSRCPRRAAALAERHDVGIRPRWVTIDDLVGPSTRVRPTCAAPSSRATSPMTASNTSAGAAPSRDERRHPAQRRLLVGQARAPRPAPRRSRSRSPRAR